MEPMNQVTPSQQTLSRARTAILQVDLMGSVGVDGTHSREIMSKRVYHSDK